jgi:hypothetical protein
MKLKGSNPIVETVQAETFRLLPDTCMMISSIEVEKHPHSVCEVVASPPANQEV